MAADRTEILLEATNEKAGPGILLVHVWSPAERRKRALKVLGICWGASLVSIIMPLVHFVLVPGFLILGPVAAFFVLAQEAQVQGCESSCPSCDQPLSLPRMPLRWPLSTVCPGCHEGVRITPRQGLRPSATDPRP